MIRKGTFRRVKRAGEESRGNKAGEESRGNKNGQDDSRRFPSSPTAGVEGCLNPKQARKKAEEWAEVVTRLGTDGILAEFQAVRTESEKASEGRTYEAFNAAPAAKKRHANVIVWDHTRVKLKDAKPPEDFIHANYVSSGGNARKWIICQGPLAETQDDFWEMIWDEGVGVLVMLCQLREAGKDKCFRYWPEEGRCIRTSGRVEIEVSTERSYQDRPPIDEQEIWISLIWLKKGGHRRRFYHYQYCSWGDQSVPVSFPAIIHLESLARGKQRELIQEEKVAQDTPIVVHCSAGLGRSGTFVCLDNAVTGISRPGSTQFSIKDLAIQLRCDRFEAIQTPAQYLFVYQGLISHLKVKRILPSSTLIPTVPPPLRAPSAELISSLPHTKATASHKTTATQLSADTRNSVNRGRRQRPVKF